MNISVLENHFPEDNFEIVERKGFGHPDTLSDHLAELLSVRYSNYTKNKYGAILHHNFDKVGLLGGASSIVFGKGYLTKPIRVLLNGRASIKFADEEIPVKKLLTDWTKEFFKSRFPTINPEKDLKFHYNLSHQSSPGKTEETGIKKGTRNHWFQPRGLEDLQELTELLSNDTSIGVGYAPVSLLESFIIKLEYSLTTGNFKKKHPWIGSDVKLIGIQYGNKLQLTLCVPQIANHVLSLDEYQKNIKTVNDYIHSFVGEKGFKELDVYINTRDNYDSLELYLTAIGSSIESGDEGLVGRGNRVNQVISLTKPMSIEGAAGKNPVYHTGKIYYLYAHKLAQLIYEKFGIKNEVYLISQSGRKLKNPWVTVVRVPVGFNKDKNKKLKAFIKQEIKNIPNTTNHIISGDLYIA